MCEDHLNFVIADVFKLLRDLLVSYCLKVAVREYHVDVLVGNALEVGLDEGSNEHLLRSVSHFGNSIYHNGYRIYLGLITQMGVQLFNTTLDFFSVCCDSRHINDFNCWIL